MTLHDQLEKAQAQFRGGDWAGTETACRAVLAHDPQHAGAMNLLAITLSRSGKPEQAMEVARAAAAAHLESGTAYGTLGNLLRAAGHVDEAIVAYQQTVRLAPRMAVGHYNLGVTLSQAGRLDEAATALTTTCRLDPSIAAAHACLGVVYRDQGNPLQALTAWRAALSLRPQDAETWHLLGFALVQLERYDEAAEALRNAIRSRMKDAPQSGASYMHLGLALAITGRVEEGIAAFGDAVRLDPALADSCEVLLGNVWFARKRLDDAVVCYQRALHINPLNVYAHLNLGNMMRDMGRPNEAVEHYRDALNLKPDFAAVHSNLLFASQYCTGVTLTELAEAHAAYDRQQAAPVRANHSRSPLAPRRNRGLRIGFVSPDLSRHPVGFFLAPLLEHLPAGAVETFCYNDRFRHDAMTARLRSAATNWREVKSLSDARLADQIRHDGVDILFDLTGHTANNRLLAFARRPAPIQITWAGYVGTTGLAEMDYLLADRFQVPADFDDFYTERVLRMPHDYICYEPDPVSPPVGPLPAVRGDGAITFGCFNHPAKITPQVVGVWANILRRVPRSRLLLKYNVWTNPRVVARMTDLFAAEEIGSSRLDFQGSAKHANWLDMYNSVDVALDPFPYSGGMTTCEALWMGVPVVTCPADTFASRHSLSHSSNVGLTIGNTTNVDEYVDRAVTLAEDLPCLTQIRASLRPMMAASPLCDAPRFADDFMKMMNGL